MTLAMMKLIMMEVRYDKDGPMGEKTDRRVRTNYNRSLLCCEQNISISKSYIHPTYIEIYLVFTNDNVAASFP